MTAEGLFARARRRGAPLLAALFLCCIAGAIAAPPAAAQTGFAPAGQPPQYAPEHSYDLQNVRLELAFDLDAGTVAGTATNTVVPLLPGVDTLVFHAAELAVQRVHLAGPAGATGGPDLPFSLDPEARTLTVQLGRAYGPQDRLDVAIDYSAKPRAGLYFVRPDKGYPSKPRQVFSQGEPDLNRYWFPTWDYPNDRATSEMLATVKSAYEVVGNGKRLEVLDRPDGRRTFHWKMEVPHPTYLISVVIGEFVRTADQWQDIPVTYYVPRELAADARRSFGETPAMIDFFSQATGRPYPYPQYAQTTVYDYMWGGMENISATTLTVRTLHDERAEPGYSSVGLVAHEAAHQWFGDLITCQDWAHVWLNEGFADYFEILYQRHAHGEDEADYVVDEGRNNYLKEAKNEYRRPIVTYRYPDPIALFDSHSYEKGAQVLHMVRFLLGEEGWWKGIREYVRRHAAQSITTEELVTALEESSGVSVRPLFDQYVFGAGHPELALRWDYQPDRRMVHLEVRQTQERNDQVGFFSFPVEIALVGEAGEKAAVQRLPVLAKEVQDLYIPADRRPRTVVFDPKGWILKSVDFDKPAAEWIVQLDTAETLLAKLEAERALGKLGGGEAVAALGRALREAPFHGVRTVAAESLAEIGTEAALAALRPGTQDRDARVRTAAYKGLGSFPGEPDLGPVLRKALETDASYHARAGAAEALARVQGDRTQAIQALTRALAQGGYEETVPAAAVQALADLDAPQAFEQAVRLSRYGAPRGSRDEALKALVTAATASQEAKKREEARKVLEGYLNDPDYLFRSDVFEALGDLGDPAAVPALERSARGEADVQQRLHARAAIDKLQKAQTASGGGKEIEELRQRIEQLERELDVLKAQVEARQGDG
jgi:aminopeptidase N